MLFLNFNLSRGAYAPLTRTHNYDIINSAMYATSRNSFKTLLKEQIVAIDYYVR